jgi:hypothetical protein
MRGRNRGGPGSRFFLFIDLNQLLIYQEAFAVKSALVSEVQWPVGVPKEANTVLSITGDWLIPGFSRPPAPVFELAPRKCVVRLMSYI